MNFPLKPPLYAINREQLDDLLYVENIHYFIRARLFDLKHFPLVHIYYSTGSSNLLIFERFTPNKSPWAYDYTEKIYYFYKHVSTSLNYMEPWFNGFGLTDYDFGDLFDYADNFSFNIPEEITIENQSNQTLIISFFRKYYQDDIVEFHRIGNRLQYYGKVFIQIPPKTSCKLKTEEILFCSLVKSGVDNPETQIMGIPPALDYDNLDDYLSQLKAIIDNHFSQLNKCLSKVDYTVKAACWNTIAPYATKREETYYFLEYKPGSLVLRDLPSWYYAAALIFGNNDYWESGEPIKEDLGKKIQVRIEYDFLTFFIWGEYFLSDSITSDVIPIPLKTVENNQIIDSPVNTHFLYFGGTGTNAFVKVPLSDPNVNRVTLIQGEYALYPSGFFNANQYPQIFANFRSRAAEQGVRAWSNQSVIQSIDPNLFSAYHGFSYCFITPLMGATIQGWQTNNSNNPVLKGEESLYRKFFYNCHYDLDSNHVFITPVEAESFTTILANKATDWNQTTGFSYQDTPYNQGGFDDEAFNLSLYPSEFDETRPAFFVTDKWENTLSPTLRSNPLTHPSSLNDTEVINYVDNILEAEFELSFFMPDSIRIREIHEALNASKFANDPDDPEVSRFANLGYYIERIARILGISVDPDGSIRSIRQRKFLESGETLPAGWPIGQWGRNQGGSQEGQPGGEPEHDKDGITYPVISNKFGVDPFTGEAGKITEGGYALCENLIQYLETFKDDLDKALGLQYSGANSFPLVQGEGHVTYEGLSVLVQENTYMISQLSRLISSCQVSSLVTQGIVMELLAHQGVPVTIKELEVSVGEGESTVIPYPAISSEAPSNFDQTLWVISQLAPLLGGKINIRKDLQEREKK